MRFISLLYCVVLIGTLFLSGCGGNQLASVTGTVKYKGKPLKEGTIIFYPSQGRPAYGKVVDGAIVEVTTQSNNDGATIGMNQVVIQSVENPDDMYKAKSILPEKYGNIKNSGLSADIKAGTNEVVFDLKENPK